MIAVHHPVASTANPLGLGGIACVELGAPDRAGLDALGSLFRALGFSRTRRHAAKDVEYWRQGDVRFLVTREPRSFASEFAREHGPSISAMGWWVADADHAVREAVRRGAKAVDGDLVHGGAPAIEGIGGSRIYLVDARSNWDERYYVPAAHPLLVRDRGFTAIDHLTNNVPKGTLDDWRRYYREIFGFTDVRSFEIRGRSTGLTSYALRSPCGSFCIPINEGSEEKSQIEEYLREYRGPGVQHLALRSDDLLASLEGLRATGVETLDIDRDYYRTVFDRVANVREDHAEIERQQVLVDGDESGYLLQIFTKNVIGPIFFELIQRRNHLSFGEGNFGALFRSIERDQERRGAL
jgi:4-hydroxyphenylpyruvate dioxygenase